MIFLIGNRRFVKSNPNSDQGGCIKAPDVICFAKNPTEDGSLSLGFRCPFG